MNKELDYLQKSYRKAYLYIKNITGLKKLSLIEVVALREIVKQTIERENNMGSSAEDEFNVPEESTAIFLYNYYGVRWQCAKDQVEWGRMGAFTPEGVKARENYFRTFQEEHHLL